MTHSTGSRRLQALNIIAAPSRNRLVVGGPSMLLLAVGWLPPNLVNQITTGNRGGCLGGPAAVRLVSPHCEPWMVALPTSRFRLETDTAMRMIRHLTGRVRMLKVAVLTAAFSWGRRSQPQHAERTITKLARWGPATFGVNSLSFRRKWSSSTASAALGPRLRRSAT